MNSIARNPSAANKPGDDEHHLVGALHRFQFLRPLRGQGLFDALQPGGEGFGVFRRGGIGLLPVALDGELRGVKLFLELQVGAQRFLGVGFVGFPRYRRRRAGLGPEAPAEPGRPAPGPAKRSAAKRRPGSQWRLNLLISIGWLRPAQEWAPSDRGSTGC